MISKKTSIILLIVLFLILISLGLLFKPIPQMRSYHHFADKRTILGIVNGWNVLSNIPFALAGIWGLFLLCFTDKIQLIEKNQRWPWIGLSVGLILTAIGSSYYHLAPDNNRLFFDRLAMTIVFTSYITALICERIDLRFGLYFWPILLGMGFSSVFLWIVGEHRHQGDLRLYFDMQAFYIFAPLILMTVPYPYTRSNDIAIVAFLYILAVFLDNMDNQIYQLSGDTISGHTLKHLAAALAGAWLIRMILKRKRMNVSGEKS